MSIFTDVNAKSFDANNEYRIADDVSSVHATVQANARAACIDKIMSSLSGSHAYYTRLSNYPDLIYNVIDKAIRDVV